MKKRLSITTSFLFLFFVYSCSSTSKFEKVAFKDKWNFKRSIASENSEDNDFLKVSFKYNIYNNKFKKMDGDIIFRGIEEFDTKIVLAPHSDLFCRHENESFDISKGETISVTVENLQEVWCENTGDEVKVELDVDYIISKKKFSWEEINEGKQTELEQMIQNVEQDNYGPEVQAYLVDTLKIGEKEELVFDSKNKKHVLPALKPGEYIKFHSPSGQMAPTNWHFNAQKGLFGPEGIPAKSYNYGKKKGEVIPDWKRYVLDKNTYGILCYQQEKVKNTTKYNPLYIAGEGARGYLDNQKGDITCSLNYRYQTTRLGGSFKLSVLRIQKEKALLTLNNLIQNNQKSKEQMEKDVDSTNFEMVSNEAEQFHDINVSSADDYLAFLKAQEDAENEKNTRENNERKRRENITNNVFNNLKSVTARANSHSYIFTLVPTKSVAPVLGGSKDYLDFNVQDYNIVHSVRNNSEIVLSRKNPFGNIFNIKTSSDWDPKAESQKFEVCMDEIKKIRGIFKNLSRSNPPVTAGTVNYYLKDYIANPSKEISCPPSNYSKDISLERDDNAYLFCYKKVSKYKQIGRKRYQLLGYQPSHIIANYSGYFEGTRLSTQKSSTTLSKEIEFGKAGYYLFEVNFKQDGHKYNDVICVDKESVFSNPSKSEVEKAANIK